MKWFVAVWLCSLIFASGGIASAQSTDAVPVYVIPITGEIDQGLTVFLRRSIEKAKNEQAPYIIFDIDTFGGRVDAALQITTLIGSLSEVTTIAYVGLHAEGSAVSWSAGALIAFAADRIYAAPGTSMGAAAPVMQTAEGTMETADEKAVSAIRTQMASLAEKNGYPPALALAMVDKDVEVIEVLTERGIEPMVRSDFETLVRNAPEGQEITEGRIISAEGKLLSLTAEQLFTYGVSAGTVSTVADLLEREGVQRYTLVRLAPSAADDAVRLLTGNVVTSLLILIGIIALFMEISSPGFGFPGAIALAAFAALFTGNILLGTVGSLELLFFVIGIALLIIEIFVIPGFGVVGISGIALMTLGLVLSMQDFVIPTFSWQWDLLGKHVLLVLGNLIAGFFIFGVLAFLVPKYTPFKRLTLSHSQETSMGYTSQESSESVRYLGKEGIALTTLRPSGKAEIGDEVVQVMTSGEFIEQGAPLSVSEVNGNRIVVRRRKENS
ncbi:MAG: nodulation protein NfeD [Spirochaetia bacterium]|nr:nodulation protein NfeD [Spirochaetia bacterium]